MIQNPSKLSAIHLVIGVLCIAFAGSAAAAEQEPQFIGLRKCKVCHGKSLIGDQVSAWQAGPHAKAFDTLKSEPSVQIATEKQLAMPAHESPECLRCHATSDVATPDRAKYPVHVEEGVQCESCHGPGSKYRKKKVMSDRAEAERQGLWSPSQDQAVCVSCHNEESPTWDPGRFVGADGSHSGFDYEQALKSIQHPIPAEVKGHYIELEKKEKARKRRENAAGR
jgi:hypothetical protein